MIYLDHAATSFPKPPAVLQAVQRWFTELGVSADRGDSGHCIEVASTVRRVRQRLGRMCDVPTHRVIFTSGATESLNRFFDGYLSAGDAVLTTALEHSSVVRPLVHRRDRGLLDLHVLAPDELGYVNPEQVERALADRDYRLLVFTHASNVVGSVMDAAAICGIARACGCTTLLDASQTAGLLPIDVGADAVAASCHKSLLAPPGLGFLAVRDEVDVTPTRFGGTGSSTALESQPEEWPAAMESGTPNTPAIFGLDAALDFLSDRQPSVLLATELVCIDELRAALGDSAIVYGPHGGARVPVLSFNVPTLDPAEAGAILDAVGIHVRTGYHCAPWLHEHLGTTAGGTIRVSVGPFTSPDDVRRVPRALPLE